MVRDSVAGVPIVLADTGPLPEEGGALEATLLEYPITGLPDPSGGALSARVLHAATVAQGQRSESEASVADLNLIVGGNTVSAGFLMARARAECHGGNASVSGSSEIAALTIKLGIAAPRDAHEANGHAIARTKGHGNNGRAPHGHGKNGPSTNGHGKNGFETNGLGKARPVNRLRRRHSLSVVLPGQPLIRGQVPWSHTK